MTEDNPSGRSSKFRGKRGLERSERRKTMEAAGFSRDQMDGTLRIGALPSDEFDHLIENNAASPALGRPRQDHDQVITRTKAAAAIAKAMDAAHSAYWAACDAEAAPIDPADLGAPAGLLDEAHERACLVLVLTNERGIAWRDARCLLWDARKR